MEQIFEEIKKLEKRIAILEKLVEYLASSQLSKEDFEKFKTMVKDEN